MQRYFCTDMGRLPIVAWNPSHRNRTLLQSFLILRNSIGGEVLGGEDCSEKVAKNATVHVVGFFVSWPMSAGKHDRIHAIICMQFLCFLKVLFRKIYVNSTDT